MAEALIRAASRGVTTWVVVDGGTPDLPQPWCDRFRPPECNGRCFHRWARWVCYPSRWRRLHRKLCVIDGRLADLQQHQRSRMTTTIPIMGAWPGLGWTLRCAAGALVMQAQEATAQPWWRMQSVEDMPRCHHFPHAFSTPADGGLTLPGALAMRRPTMHWGTGCSAPLVLRDNLLHRGRIEARLPAAPSPGATGDHHRQ